MQKLCLAVILTLAWVATGISATQTQAKLVLSAETARPGETVLAGVHLHMNKGWHTYWRNGGDAGAPTQIEWTLPEGITAGQIQWPIPEKTDTDGLFTYDYHGDVVLLVPLALAPTLQTESLELRAEVSWLECEELCVPGSASVQASLAIGPQSKSSDKLDLIQRFQRRLPLTQPDLKIMSEWEGKGETRTIRLRWTAASEAAVTSDKDSAKPKRGDFFPYESDEVQFGHATTNLAAPAGRIALAKSVSRLGSSWPKAVMGLAIELDSAGKTLGAYEVRVPIPGQEGSGAPAAPVPEAPPKSNTSLAAMLGLAFLGGLILNIMPCVLPVIALKILGFVNQSKEEPARVRKLGIVYTLGVLASFLVLASLVIGVQQAGKLASWGMQFQNPVFLLLITVLVLLVALNLFGVYEITLGGPALGAAATLASREGYSGAFFNGVLATALATPCTAPFLGVALGFAFTQPAPTIVLVFLVVGLGLALPYALLSWFPSLLRFLPKPGAWMQRFKVAMGFPMLATAVWLFSILPRHYGIQGVLWIGLFLICIALAAWIYGQFIQRGVRGRAASWGVCVILLAGSYAYALEGQLHWRHPPAELPSDLVGAPSGIGWERWSSEAVEKAQLEGRPILVDFTADWCLTCKGNKATSLEIDSVQRKLREINAIALLADYTRGDEAITKELRRFGRAGVPLVLVYPGHESAPPEVLPTVLTPSIVLNALDRAASTDRAQK